MREGMHPTGDATYPYVCDVCGDWLTAAEAEHHACSSTHNCEVEGW